MNIDKVRKDFPLLSENPELAYLDNAATTQKPESVLQAVTDFYTNANANPLRGLYDLSQKATDTYEEAREEVRRFIHAGSCEEIIFTRNASESLNLLAYSLGEMLHEGDEIVLSVMEHHSNLIPWQQLARRKGPNAMNRELSRRKLLKAHCPSGRKYVPWLRSPMFWGH